MSHLTINNRHGWQRWTNIIVRADITQSVVHTVVDITPPRKSLSLQLRLWQSRFAIVQLTNEITAISQLGACDRGKVVRCVLKHVGAFCAHCEFATGDVVKTVSSGEIKTRSLLVSTIDDITTNALNATGRCTRWGKSSQ